MTRSRRTSRGKRIWSTHARAMSVFICHVGNVCSCICYARRPVSMKISSQEQHWITHVGKNYVRYSKAQKHTKYSVMLVRACASPVVRTRSIGFLRCRQLASTSNEQFLPSRNNRDVRVVGIPVARCALYSPTVLAAVSPRQSDS